MNPSEYSPFQYQNGQSTAQRETTSFKKYPTNKYYGYDEAFDVKNKLFEDKTSENQHKMFFKNDKIKDYIKISDPNVTYELPRSHRNQSYQIHGNHRQPKSSVHTTFLKPSTKKQSNASKKRTVRTKSMQLKCKKSITLTKQNTVQSQELQMYKKLCVTLRKQNDELNQKIEKQSKKEMKFSSEIEKLQQKIGKMYDYCIQKNISAKNVDISLKDLIKKQLKKNKRANQRGNEKENTDISRNIIKHQTKWDTKISKVKLTERDSRNHQTIASTRTSKRQLNGSYMKNDKSFMRKSELSKETPRQKNISSGQQLPCKRIVNKKALQYEMSEQSSEGSEISRHEQLDSGEQGQYRQFFRTFIKSLQIFQKNSTSEHKSKGKLLREGGYIIQWAKQQWLDIVQYLIKKGYVAGSELKTGRKSQYEKSQPQQYLR